MRNVANKFLIFLSFIFFLNSCVEPFELESIVFEDLLVVDGFISTEATPYKITLSRTYALDTFQMKPETLATVWIENGEGSIFYLQEQNPGDYYTPADFMGTVGIDYQLFINTRAGNQYISEKVKLKRTPDIDNLYGAYISRPPDNKGEVASGIQFYLDTGDPTNNTRFYRWEWSDTYEIQTPYISNIIYENGEVVENPVRNNRCWKSDSSRNIIIQNSLALSDDKITKFPIRFINKESQDLRVKYSLLVKQYALSEDAYTFWKRLKENNESQGTLFDSQPGSVIGNIKSVSNPKEVVLGYFFASEVKSKRQFFSQENFPEYSPAPYLYACKVDTLPKAIGDMVITIHEFNDFFGINQNLIDWGYDSFGNEIHFMVNKPCTDCSLFANPVKPQFWID